MADVLIVGAGLAGTAAALTLARQGIRVRLLDVADPLPYCFKAEKLSPEQIARFRRLNLGGVLDAVADRYRDPENAEAATVGRQPVEQYGMFYHDLVNAARRQLPDNVDLKIGKVRKISTSDDRQQVILDSGEVLEARLLILASGNSGNLLSQLNINRRIVSRTHSMAFGFTVARLDGKAFEFNDLVYRADHTDTRIGFISFFRIGSAMRANMFVYWDGAETNVHDFLADPVVTLDRLLPAVTKLTGPLQLTSHIDRRASHLQTVEGHVQSGVALIGDAFQTNCPATGTGMTKGLNDVEFLCTSRVQDWLSTPGMGVEKISQFYADEGKVNYDRDSLQEALTMRRAAVDAGLHWRLRRTARSWKRTAKDWWSHWSADAKLTPR
jgi:2-polyprenyl-6-methoxyphenol hydroxylase-like FAD-dependent oxidoreductase